EMPAAGEPAGVPAGMPETAEADMTVPPAVTVRCGARRCAARIVRQYGGEPVLLASRALAGALCLVPGLPYQVRRRAGELCLGPVIGILLDEGLDPSGTVPAGPWDVLALRYGDAGGLLFV